MSHLMTRTVRPHEHVAPPAPSHAHSRPDLGLVGWALLGVVVGSLAVHGFTSPRSVSQSLQQVATSVRGASVSWQ